MTDKELTPPLTTNVDGENKDEKFNLGEPYFDYQIGDGMICEIDNDEFKQLKSDIAEINKAQMLNISEGAIIVLTYFLYYKNYKKCDALAEYYERQNKDKKIEQLELNLVNLEIAHYEMLYRMTKRDYYLAMYHQARDKQIELRRKYADT